MKRIIIAILLFLPVYQSYAQTAPFDTLVVEKRERPAPLGRKYRHLVGIKAAYNMSSMDLLNATDIKNVITYENFFISYTNYHLFWQDYDWCGIQVAISKQKQGYKSDEGTVTYDALVFPFVSQFHLDFWRMRILLNLGGFGGYRSNKVSFDGTKGFEKTDRKADFGFIGGGGIAFVFKPFEVHAEVNYQYSLSNLYDPDRDFGYNQYIFTYPHQLLFTLGVHFHL